MTSDPKPSRGQDGSAVKTVAKVLDLLEHVAAAGRPQTVSELAAATGFNVSTAHRLMQTLAARNYVEQNPTSRAYTLGSRLLELGVAYAGNLDLMAAARPRIEALRDRAAETVHLAILAGRDVVEICAAGGRQAVTVSRGAGRRDPAHCTATGKVLLAAQPDAEVARFLAQGPLQPATASSICDPDRFRSEIARVRADGFAIDDEELVADVCCIGVAIRDRSGRAIAAVSVAMPKARFRSGDIDRWVAMLGDTSAQISHALALSGEG